MTKKESILPKGVRALSSIEMWERFSFYILQSLLVLYASASFQDGGLGWSPEASVRLSGTYGAMVYISPIVGGFLADKFIGRRLAAALGAMIMGIGQLIIMIQSDAALYAGLGLLVLGCGFLKPNLSAMVGEFFSENDNKRHSAFTVFYMAVNIGALVGMFLSGLVSNHYGFRYSFLLGAIGFAIAIFNLIVASRHSLRLIGLRQNNRHQKLPPLNPLEKTRIKLYLGMCVANIVWNIVYALPFGLLTYYAEHNINNMIGHYKFPVTWYLTFYSVLIIFFSYLLAKVYDFLHGRNVSLTINRKLAAGYWVLAIGCLCLLPLIHSIQMDPNYIGHPMSLVIFYIFFSISELLTIPVLLSAATQMAPKSYAATMVSCNMFISWGIGAYLGGEFGALTFHYSAMMLFYIVIGISVLLAIAHRWFDPHCERLCAMQ